MNPTTIRRRSLALVLAAATPFVLLACSDDGPEQAEIESSAEATTEQSTTTDGPTDDGDGSTDDGSTDDDGGSDGSAPTEAEGDGDAEAPAPDDGEVLGSSTGNHPADPNDDTLVPLQLDVRGIERMDGDIVGVRLSITNTGDDATYELWSTLAESGGQYDVGGAALLDPPNDKRYLTLYDSAETCLCTADAAQLAVGPGETLDLYAQFPAPPEDVTEITFTLPGFEPVDGLTIQ